MKVKWLSDLYVIGDFTLTFFWIILFILSLAGIINIDQSPYNFIDTSLLVLFTFSYIVRFVLAKNKNKYFMHNIFDLLAIIPLNLLDIGVLGRANRVFRIIGLLGRLGHKKNSVIYRNGFIYALYASGCIIFVGSGLYSIAENISYEDSVWFSIVTMTTVGYGDITPTTTIGRIIASITMLFGIGFIGFLTSTITNYFKEQTLSTKKKNNANYEELNDKIEKLTKLVEDLSQKKEN